MNHFARVGAILIIGAGLLGGVFFFLSDYYAQVKSYPIWVVFDNALGLQTGARVRMAGVDVGTVGEISLTPENRARLRLNVDKQYGIPKESKFTIASGALIGEKYVDILPGQTRETLQPDEVIEGPDQIQKPFQIEEVGGEVNKLIQDFQKVSQNLDHMLGDPALQRGIVESVVNLARTTARAEQLVLGVQGVVIRNQAQLDRTVANLAEASQELKGAMVDIRTLVSGPQVSGNVTETAVALRTASERLDAVLQDVRDVTADPEVAQNLKQTADNLNQATAYARDVGEKVNRIIGSGKPKLTINLPRPQFQSGTRFMLESAGSGSGQVRTDLTLTLPTGTTSGLRLGLYDFTESNKLIAQRIQQVDPQTAVRYGLYGSRIGVGMDYEASARWNVTADLYDPKFPRLDLRGRYYYTNDLGLVFGVDGIMRQPRAIIGVQWRK